MPFCVQPLLSVSYHLSVWVGLRCSGRYVVSARALEMGATVLTEEPFAAVIKAQPRGSRCEWCFRYFGADLSQRSSHPQDKLLYVVPCLECGKALYCSWNCCRCAGAAFHSRECGPLMHLLQSLPEECTLAFRLLLHGCDEVVADERATERKEAETHDDGGWERGEDAVAGQADGVLPSRYSAVVQLGSHWDDTPDHLLRESVRNAMGLFAAIRSHQRDVHDTLMRFAASTVFDACPGSQLQQLWALLRDEESQGRSPEAESQGRSPEAESQGRSTEAALTDNDADADDGSHSGQADSGAHTAFPLRVLILHHLLQCRTNAYALTALHDPHDDGDGDVEATVLENVATVEQTRVAVAVYPQASLFNHSCEPNVLVQFQGRRLQLRASHPISSGAELFNCYGPHRAHHSFEERQAALWEQYFFRCGCAPCGDRVGPNSFKCQNGVCGGRLAYNTAGTYRCVECHSAPTEATLAKLRKFAGVSDERLTQVQQLIDNGQWQEALASASECLEMCRVVFFPLSKSIARLEDTVARVYASLGKYDEAARHVDVGLHVLSALFGNTASLEVAREHAKLASLLYHCDGSLNAVRARRHASFAAAAFVALGCTREAREMEQLSGGCAPDTAAGRMVVDATRTAI